MDTTAVPIAVGQRWRTRGGALVIVTKDRAELEDDKPGILWRWALSNSHIVNARGRCGTFGDDHDSDLVEHLGEMGC